MAQHRPDNQAPSSNTAKVLLFGLLLLAILVVVGLLAAALAGSAVSDLFGGFANS